MSDHEGFEMLDETFGVREASDTSDADSPLPKNSASQISSLLQQPPQPSSTPAGSLNDHAHRLGRVGVGTRGEMPQEQAASMPGDGMTAVPPQQEAKGCQGGTVPEKGATLKIQAARAGWDRFRLTASATGERREVSSSTLGNPSHPEDPRPRSFTTKNDNSDGHDGNQGSGSTQSNMKNISKLFTTKSSTTSSTSTAGAPEDQRGAMEKGAAFSVSDSSFDTSVVPASEPRDGGRAAADVKEAEVVNDVVDELLVAAPAAQLQQAVSLDRSAGASVARAQGESVSDVTVPPPLYEGGPGSTRTNDEKGSADLFLSARAGKEGFLFPPVPAPAPAGAQPPSTPPFGAFPNAATATRSNTDVPPSCLRRTPPTVALEAPFNPRATAPLPPTPSRAAGLAQRQQEQPSVAPPGAAGSLNVTPPSGPLPSPVVSVVSSGDKNRKPGGCGSASSTVATALPLALAEDEKATMELVGMGFDRKHVIQALTECGRGESWKEAAISLLLEPQMSTMSSHVEPPLGFDGDPESRVSGDERQARQRSAAPAASSSSCPICLGNIQAGEVFTVDCREQHTFCVDCLYQHCSVQLLDSGLIPACPLSNMTCGHELSQDEVERVFLLKSYSSASDAEKYCSTATTMEKNSDKRALDTCRTLLTRRGLESTGAVPCVSPECDNWMVPEGGGQRVRCNSCLVEFCGRCKRAPYHYTAKCEEVVAFGREWSSWLTEGKATFLKAMAAQDGEHKALLDQHNSRKKEHDRAVEEAERLRLEYDRMEDWKESRCRCCPHCGRTIEKLSGCDHMVCGLDAHGGNVQTGCGKRFLWHQARPYKGDRGERKAIPFTEQEPAAAARSRHFIAEGIPLRCDRCHRDVVGPLFRCVHCPSFACCLECQDMACRDPRHVHHTFQVVDGEKQDTLLPASAAPDGGRGSGGVGRGGGVRDMDVDGPV